MGICSSSNTLDKYDDNIELFSLNERKYQAKIVRVYDGDTCFAVFIMDGKPVKFKIRMQGYDSPEMKPLLSVANRDKEIEAAKAAKAELEKLVLNKIVVMECGKWDKYGRLLAVLHVSDANKMINVNSHMILSGFGYRYNGGKKQQFE
jgi:endonuclease YncB( thermonuclease family)